VLDRLGVHTIVVHPLVWTADERRLRLAALESEERLTLRRSFDDVVPARYAAFGLGQERVYRLAPAAPATAPCTPTDPIDPSPWALTGSGEANPYFARDGNLRTAWRTDLPQAPGDRLEVALKEPDTVSAIALWLGYPYDEFPRNLVVMTDGETGGWERVAYADGPHERWATIEELIRSPREARLVLRLPPRRVRAVRLMVGRREQDLSWPRWRVPEIALYRGCR
jgi:hypothetical protein